MIIETLHRIMVEHTCECVFVGALVLYYALLWLAVHCYDQREEIAYKRRRIKEQIIAMCSMMQKCCRVYFKLLIRYVRKGRKKLYNGENLQWGLKNICYAGIFFWLVWSFETNWFGWYAEHICKYFAVSDLVANLLLALYIAGVVISFALQKIYKRAFSKEGLTYLILIILFMYVRYRICGHLFDFKTLSFVNLPIAYIDVIFVVFVIYVIALAVLEKQRTNYINATFNEKNPFYYYDAPITDLDGDTLGFKDQAHVIAEKIGTLTKDHSWSVGVVGSWGSGKTSFMNLIKSQLKKTGRHLIVEFNPRMASKPQKIQEMALDCLEVAVRPYNTNLRSLMRKYMFALQLEGANGWVQVVLSWLKSAYGVELTKEELNKALGELPKQVIYIFDDFDRLTKEEIVEVLKLIDGNANFNNIIYLAAYDREQVAKLLDSETYIEKYFGIEIHVPLAKDVNLRSYLFKELRVMIPAKPKDDKLSRSLDDVIIRHWTIFKKGLSTLRDVKRFLNIVKTDVLTIYTLDLDTEDFILLEFLKYHHIGLYETLWHLPEKYASYREYVTIHKELNKQNELDDIDKEVLNLLFAADSNSNNNPAKIRKRDNYASYFIRPERSSDAIKLNDIYSPSIDKSALRTILDKACSNENVLKNLCDSIEQFGRLYIDDDETMKRYLYIILYLNTKVGDTHVIPETGQICRESFYSTINVQRHIGVEHKPMGDYILNYYRNRQWTSGDISFLSGVVPDLYRGDSERDYVFSYREIEPVIKKGFEDLSEIYLQTKRDDDFKLLISVFYLCVDHIEPDTTKIVLDVEACSKMRDIIVQAPVPYINSFVRLAGWSSSPDVNHVTCEPFWQQIFGSTEAITEFMSAQDANENSKLARIKNFWRLYEANGYKMIRFEHQGNVQEIINNDLIEQVNQLDILQNLWSQVMQIRFLDNRTEKFKVASDIEKQVNKIPLDIKLKYDILRETKLHIPRAS